MTPEMKKLAYFYGGPKMTSSAMAITAIKRNLDTGGAFPMKDFEDELGVQGVEKVVQALKTWVKDNPYQLGHESLAQKLLGLLEYTHNPSDWSVQIVQENGSWRVHLVFKGKRQGTDLSAKDKADAEKQAAELLADAKAGAYEP